MLHFTAVFGKKMPDFTEISRKVICCSLNPQNHKAYLRHLKAVNVKNVTDGHLLFIDMPTCYRVARSHVQLHVAPANYKLLMATVQTNRPTGIEPSPLPHKTSTNALKSTGIGKILIKCMSERAKLQNFTEFHGKLPISRKTVHFTVRVTAVKSRNRLGPTYIYAYR